MSFACRSLFLMDDQKPERIAKVMARAGLCSRRDAERWIADGRVQINGQTLETPAITVLPEDDVVVDGKPLCQKQATRLWLYHKPVGLVTTHKDEHGRPTVFENLPKNLPRVMSVGRLDLNSEGLLLLTNDGALVRQLEHPKTGLPRTYRVRVKGDPDPEKLKALKKGVTVKGVRYGTIDAKIERTGTGKNHWLIMTLHEGKNREIRKVMTHIGMTVNRLIRVSYGAFKLGQLKQNAVVEAPQKQLVQLMESLS